MPKKASKKTSTKKAAKPEVEFTKDDELTTISKEYLDKLLDRIEKLEAKQKTLVKGLQFAGDTITPVFGQAIIGRVFTAIADKIK